jgi:hypothetical protein
VPQNSENKGYMLYQLYIQVKVWYIHGIYMIYTDVSRKHIVTANLVWVCVYIYMVYIYYIYNIYKVYTRYIYYVYHKDIPCTSQGYNYKKRYGTKP